MSWASLVVRIACVVGALSAAGCGGTATPRRAPVAQHAATRFDGLAQVGPLFVGPSDAGPHICTASVVDSPHHDLVATAAHCLSGPGTDLSFAPMYHDGVAPFGTWQVQAAYVSPGWIATRDPHEDVAFLLLAPQRRNGRIVDVEDLTGANTLVVSQGYGVEATVVGYALGVGGRPVTCTGPVSDSGGYPTFGCDGFVDGTSGGPWITGVDPATHGGDLYGVIGGLHQGGCTSSVSYSSYFDATTQALYLRAVQGGAGDEVPAAGSDGC
ncbi:MAG TPA: trypsin-like serine protease [Acidimicrobiales bacterium]|nr:trypsin-like serine protease [Acidimicrobiales bacterium]